MEDEIVQTETKDALGYPVITFLSDKFKAQYYISKHPEKFYWQVNITQGQLPKSLEGKWSAINKAIAEVRKHIRTSPMSKRRRVEKTYEENHPEKV